MVQFGLESEFEDGRGGSERGRPMFVHGNLLKRIAGYVFSPPALSKSAL
jgi:hypothetical protein